MAKLVVLSQGLTGSSYELKVDKTTIGRLEDNTFQIPEASVSSHHCEVVLKGSDVLIRDLDSTNGTFINGEKIKEAVLKPGQVLRLGQVDLRLESESAPAAGRKVAEHTMVVPQGVNLNELDKGPRAAGFDTATKGFAKKDNKVNKYFLIGGIIVGCIIAALLFYVFSTIKG